MHVFFQLKMLHLHPHFTRHIRKKISKTIRILHVWKSTDLQIRILPEADVDGVYEGGQFQYMMSLVHMRSISVHVFLEYGFGTWEVPFRYIIKSITVHFKRNFAARLACSAAGLQMLNWCLVCYAQHDCATWRSCFDIKCWPLPYDQRAALCLVSDSDKWAIYP